MKKSNEQLIQEEIDRLHHRGSGDFQRLVRQVAKNKKEVRLNIPQIVAASSTAKYLLLEWGRGTGKTTMRGFRYAQILREMPRSTGLLIGPSYQFLLTRILPSLEQGLEMFGIHKNLHYFVGKQPPPSWRKSWVYAYQSPDKFDRYITFWNGVGIHLISHDVPGDGRGLNADWADGDEAALLDPSKIQENTDPTLRGTNAQAFDKSHFFGSRFYSSSTPLTPEGAWFTDYEAKALSDPKQINFIYATCEYNKHNLRKGYIEVAERDAYAPWVFEAEYKNKRPKFTKDGFYPLLDPDIHCYSDFDYMHYTKVGQREDCRGDRDLTKGVPLIVAMDFGAAINCLTINQHLKSINLYRTLKDMYVLGSDQKIQDDLMQNFHEYYQYHQASCDIIYLYYDRSGNHRTGNTRKTRAEQAATYLRKKGWKVQLCTIGMNNPDHELKHILWNAILQEKDPRLPKYRMNKDNCRNLYISMRHAKTKQSRGIIQKDKSSEKSSKIQRQHATDLSDANDMPIFDLFYKILTGYSSYLPGIITSTR
jgi:hypothetical protein